MTRDKCSNNQPVDSGGAGISATSRCGKGGQGNKQDGSGGQGGNGGGGAPSRSLSTDPPSPRRTSRSAGSSRRLSAETAVLATTRTRAAAAPVARAGPSRSISRMADRSARATTTPTAYWARAGGLGGNASDGTATFGAAGSAGAGGNSNPAGAFTSAGTTISTKGDFAAGIAFQSIGGDGDTGGYFVGMLRGSGRNGGNENRSPRRTRDRITRPTGRREDAAARHRHLPPDSATIPSDSSSGS